MDFTWTPEQDELRERARKVAAEGVAAFGRHNDSWINGYSKDFAKVMADNIRQVILGGTPKPYKHKYAGSVASLGLYKGVAQVYGIKLKGFPAWLMHRTYHMSRIPSFNRKVRVVADWTLAFLLKREVISLGQLHAPREEFVHLATPTSDDKVAVRV